MDLRREQPSRETGEEGTIMPLLRSRCIVQDPLTPIYRAYLAPTLSPRGCTADLKKKCRRAGLDRN